METAEDGPGIGEGDLERIIGSLQEKDFDGFSDNYDEHLMSSTQLHSTRLLTRSAPPSLQKYSSTPVLNRSSLRERYQKLPSWPIEYERCNSSQAVTFDLCFLSDMVHQDLILSTVGLETNHSPRFRSVWNTPVNGEEIHTRVKNILRTHSARQRLSFMGIILELLLSVSREEQPFLSSDDWVDIKDDSCLSKEESTKTSKTGVPSKKRNVSCIDSSSNSDLQSCSSIRQSIMVHLDNGDYWTSQAAEYKNKPHRAIFEDSLEKIYRNMYKKASGSISKNK
ncbi:hypothetical protein JD844_018020 [Phrynosoma platyrhinos]|uniref:Uncharacterized protein n=1 Tax=Phrynosoma platyrhinos TaxID=52577 RepID=A0ABQ7SMV8_PHRPL|nr:hypothetical protein JD844_018020 [Phrynosoma platyrhinos]